MGKKESSTRDKVVVPPGGWPKSGQTKSPVLPPLVADAPKRSVVLDIDSSEILTRRMVWRFSGIDKDGDWSPNRLTTKEAANLFDKMASFESMTIGELFKPGSEHGKSYDVASMPHLSQKRLEALALDDETEISRLRCAAKQRLYGFLREHVFHVLWWDPEHQVWPSQK